MNKEIFQHFMAWRTYATITMRRRDEVAPWRDQYRVLQAYYLNNGLYEIINQILSRVPSNRVGLQSIVNPAFRVVEFYAAKIWPGNLPDALPITTDNQAIVEPLQQVWDWSNWQSKKQAAARSFSVTGDMFLKVHTNARVPGDEASRVVISSQSPETVTDFTVDESGFLTSIRLDVQKLRKEPGGSYIHYIYTEVWNKDDQLLRIWRRDGSAPQPLEQLGTPLFSVPFSEMGIDFIPIVWQPFRDIGEERGCGSFSLQIEKIDEANREANRLAQMLFRYNKAYWAVKANAVDSANRPLPPPVIEESAKNSNTGSVLLGDEDMFMLPGMSDIEALVPPINYMDALEVLKHAISQVEADLPELAYYKLRDMNNISGIAVARILGDAVDRLSEARSNAETALIRAHKMALTLGNSTGLLRVDGSFENGDFDHTITPRDAFPMSIAEMMVVFQSAAAAGIPIAFTAELLGMSEEMIEKLETALREDQERRTTFANATLNAAATTFDRNGNPDTRSAVEQFEDDEEEE